MARVDVKDVFDAMKTEVSKLPGIAQTNVADGVAFMRERAAHLARIAPSEREEATRREFNSVALRFGVNATSTADAADDAVTNGVLNALLRLSTAITAAAV